MTDIGWLLISGVMFGFKRALRSGSRFPSRAATKGVRIALVLERTLGTEWRSVSPKAAMIVAEGAASPTPS